MTDDEDTRWTDAARERFAARTEEFAAAVRRHGDVVLALSARQADVPALFAANDALAAAADAFGAAQFDLTGTFPSFELPDDEEDDEDDDAFPDAVAGLLLVHRADYAVTDAEAVLAAGRAAYRQVWPTDTDEDAAVSVRSLDRAVHELQHAGGLSALDDVPGLEEAGSVTWVLDAADDDARRRALTMALGSVEDGGFEPG